MLSIEYKVSMSIHPLDVNTQTLSKERDKTTETQKPAPKFPSSMPALPPGMPALPVGMPALPPGMPKLPIPMPQLPMARQEEKVETPPIKTENEY